VQARWPHIRRGRPRKVKEFQEALKLVRRGMSIAEACRIAGISRQTFYNNLKPRTSRRPTTAKVETEWDKLVQALKELKEAASKLNSLLSK
jgi:predicted DNA-binding protein (UPF0251 family)